MVFGPGIGGVLSKVSINFPILLDGAITLVTSALVAIFLVETPAFLRVRAERSQGCLADPSSPAVDSASASPSRVHTPQVHVIGLSTFFFGVVFGTIVSMYAVFMDAKFGFGSMQVGFVFMGVGFLMIVSNMLLSKRLQNLLGLHKAACLSTVLCGFFLFIMAKVASLPASVGLFMVGVIFNSLRMATNPNIVAELTETSTRGIIFGWVQRYNNFGRFVGPVVMGHLAEIEEDLPFTLGVGTAAILSAVLLLVMACLPPSANVEAASTSLAAGPDTRSVGNEASNSASPA